MARLRQRFDLPVGLSDHTLDNLSAVVAASLGAVMIEKHFTLDRKMPGVDQSISMQPEDLRMLKSDTFNVAKILGENEKLIQQSEIPVKQSARRGLVARVDIPAGTPLQADMLACKRPGTGIPPDELDRVLGKSAKVLLSAEQVITWEMF
jgi:sialic acid synthase SpsE